VCSFLSRSCIPLLKEFKKDMTAIVFAGMGILLLSQGWRLFWMFVGVVGFAAGLRTAQLYFGTQPIWMFWMMGIVCGIIGAAGAVFFQRVAVAVGGFTAGSILIFHLAPLLTGQNANLVLGLGGGILGAVTLYLIFDWALILLSSIVGATFVLDALGWSTPYAPVLFLLLAAVGVVFQSRSLKVSRNSVERNPTE